MNPRNSLTHLPGVYAGLDAALPLTLPPLRRPPLALAPLDSLRLTLPPTRLLVAILLLLLSEAENGTKFFVRLLIDPRFAIPLSPPLLTLAASISDRALCEDKERLELREKRLPDPLLLVLLRPSLEVSRDKRLLGLERLELAVRELMTELSPVDLQSISVPPIVSEAIAPVELVGGKVDEDEELAGGKCEGDGADEDMMGVFDKFHRLEEFGVRLRLLEEEMSMGVETKDDTGREYALYAEGDFADVVEDGVRCSEGVLPCII